MTPKAKKDAGSFTEGRRNMRNPQFKKIKAELSEERA